MACVKKLRNVHLFRHRSANQIAVMQIHSTRFLDPFCNNKQEEMCNDRIVFSHLFFASSFVFISTYRHCSGKRFDWLQYASTEISPLYVRHALGHPLTDACSVNQASRFGRQVIRGWAGDAKTKTKKLCVHVIGACLMDKYGI